MMLKINLKRLHKDFLIKRSDRSGKSFDKLVYLAQCLEVVVADYHVCFPLNMRYQIKDLIDIIPLVTNLKLVDGNLNGLITLNNGSRIIITVKGGIHDYEIREIYESTRYIEAVKGYRLNALRVDG